MPISCDERVPGDVISGALEQRSRGVVMGEYRTQKATSNVRPSSNPCYEVGSLSVRNNYEQWRKRSVLQKKVENDSKGQSTRAGLNGQPKRVRAAS